MRTLDDIVPPSRRKQEASEPLRPRAPRRFPYATAVITLVIIVAAGAALWYYSGASVEITPSTTTLSASGSYIAAADSGALTYKIITADKIASQSVPSTGTKTVSTVASGTITISNTQATTQKLITNTRFASPDGLIYRIHSAVTIPAKGSIQATVYADQPGATYNIGPSAFTIPGFANTAQFTQVTASSQSSMTGGASGVQPVVADATLASTAASLRSALSPDLSAALAAQVPEGYVLLAGAATTTYRTLDATPSTTTGMVDVREEGTASAVVMPSAALAAALAQTIEGANYTGEPLTIQDPASLTLVPSSGLPSSASTSFSFSLSGTAKLAATIDPNQIASAVAGKTRTAAEVALTNYPAVKQAVLILRPFWASTFPEDPAKIRVVVESPQ